MKMLEKFKTNRRDFFESTKSITFAVVLALIFRSIIAAPYTIPTGSMIPTLKIRDFIFVSKLSYGLKIPFTNKNLVKFGEPKRGDVIVFIVYVPSDSSDVENRGKVWTSPPEGVAVDSIDFIKRVVAVGGDIVELRNDILYINDKPMPREALDDTSILEDCKRPEHDARIYKEKLDNVNHYAIEFYPFPDNFGPITVPSGHVFMMGDNRDNSKDSRFWGPLPLENVRGKALFIWLSFDTEKLSPFQPADLVRWSRLGKKII